MRIGLDLRYWDTRSNAAQLALAEEAERLGYTTVWVAEAFGSDAVSALGWLAAHTRHIGIGSAVLQMPARSPAATAMAAATLDALSEGRFRLGLGVSGPQVSEGWYGERFRSPLNRTREYLDVVRMALRREEVRYSGERYVLPLPDGPGKAIRLDMQPVRRAVPVYLGAMGPRNLELTGELADGWLPLFFSADHAQQQIAHVRKGAARAGRTLDGFDVAPVVPLVPGDDWERCAELVRHDIALYVGGMGSLEKNFYYDQAARLGFAAAAAEIRDKFLAGDRRGAMEAVPVELIDSTSLLGPMERIADRIRHYADAGVTTLTVAPYHPEAAGAVAALRTAADAMVHAGVV
ncbi:LLM class F420-dependent oxidoreductase [Streptomyces violaceorubidus]|uniref:LLM class F420-dependent oxidoreductase n=1 Tax=Streptomyces violaceorubidus TaxID=284042 RepID=A0ABV1T494_9ACTN